MAFLAERRTLEAIVLAAALGTSVAPRAACAQRDVEPVTGDEQRIVDAIRAEESRNGPYSAHLIDLLTALGQVYRDAGDHRLATVATTRALKVVRANYGFSSLDQAPLLRGLVEDADASGALALATDREHELLTLAGKNPPARDERSVRPRVPGRAAVFR